MSARKKQPEKVSSLRRSWNCCKRHKLSILAGLIVIAYGVVSNVVSVPINHFIWSKLFDGPQQETNPTIAQEIPTKPIHASDEPSPPEDYPTLAAIRDKPSDNDVKPFALGGKRQVVFRYKNATHIPLKLLVLDWQYQLFPGKGPSAKSDGWYAWDFPATDTFVPNKEFSLGWYTFYIKRLDTGQRVYLDTHKFSDPKRPAIEVTFGSGTVPFHAEYPTLGDSDVQ